MTTLKDVFTQYAPQYVEKFKARIPKPHLKAIEAIVSCRTAARGIVTYDCAKCKNVHFTFLSCGNRHCNVCQGHKTKQWLGKQLHRQMPGHHFMTTFTVPEQLRRDIRSNQRKAYSALFDASSQTLKAFAADPKYVGGDIPGFFGVLHTWGRQLQYHPHIHYIIPGGAYSTNDSQWHPSGLAYFAPVKAMSKIFREKLKACFKANGLYSRIDPKVWELGFNVNCQPMTESHHSVRYLAPYVFKVAITNTRIIKEENRMVFFKYKKKDSNRWRTMSLNVFEFIRRFLQHVLPTGFMKVRYYGFMHPCASVKADRIRTLIEIAFGFEIDESPAEKISVTGPVCSECGGRLILRNVAGNIIKPVFDYD